ncbi:DNA kinase/phosphatase Pnk1 [Neophaeococcomyces mojaviensis]|uniref:DNA kinase/phosphatase Pnk1 n=1 Tax=Neophaeococcomyces mojaviensis TaxID=3383035 RepID=A0ACC3A7F8_9EURO|nr:DNA kinase/phosphatase Pnk1 [Knufia sp. JES_112]
MKRPASPDGSTLSPPPVKRKVESTTTSKAVATFFKPASQREPERLTWRIVDHSLIVGRSSDPSQPSRQLQRPVKVAAFDLDDTIIAPTGKIRFNRNAASWKWWDASVPGRLKQLHEDGYLVVIISNQGSISLKDNAKSLQKDSLSLKNFKDQLTSILRQLNCPVSIYAATGNDKYRKPRTGMWEQLKDEHDLDEENAIDMENSFYVGDAAGREQTDQRRKDHATSDRDLAANIGIKFQTPEEFFLGLETEPYLHSFEPREILESALSSQQPKTPFTKQHNQELVIFCGSPGAGKSSFYWKVLKPQGYERVNQDILKTRDKCIKVARQLLGAGSSVVVDNTNRDREARKYWVDVARDTKVPIRCIYFNASARLCEHNDVVRAHNSSVNPENRTILPPIAFRSFAQSFVEPKLDEGFQDITTVSFQFEGTDAERELWSKYWVSKFST